MEKESSFMNVLFLHFHLYTQHSDLVLNAKLILGKVYWWKYIKKIMLIIEKKKEIANKKEVNY